jgi:[acyl-carrier-protein] S-malonyltransferase
MVAFFFPGQGSQAPGMGRALCEAFPAAREVFEAADDALGWPLSRTCFEGPEEDLRRTEVTQPALLTTSVATLRALEAARPDLRPTRLAGHSLGEWSALVASGALEFGDAVRLVRERGRLMQAAVPEGEGVMLAVLGLPPSDIERICAEAASATEAVFAPANYNAPEQTVISGHARAAGLAKEKLAAAGAKKVVTLPVSAPFHCPLMEPAAAGLAKALEPVALRAPAAPVIANVDAAPHDDPGQLTANLIRQVTAPVRWVEVVERVVREGETLALELGSGKVLAGLARRIDRSLRVLPVGDPASLEKALEAL